MTLTRVNNLLKIILAQWKLMLKNYYGDHFPNLLAIIRAFDRKIFQQAKD